jgi:uncharacterized membrane protein HdeD (DUF308 family)
MEDTNNDAVEKQDIKGNVKETVAGLKDRATDWASEAKGNAGKIVLLGIVTAIAGFLALVWPWISGLAVTVVIGVCLLIGGVARLVGAFSAGSFGQGTLAFIGGALTLLAGVILVARPGAGLAALTLMLAAYLLVDGIFGAVLAFKVRPEKGWGWMLFSAVMAGILGILLLAEWPLSGVWAIGTLLGINLMFSGFSLISIGSAARRLAKTEI